MAATFSLTIFVVLAATQVISSSGSCVPCVLPAPSPCQTCGGYSSGPIYVPASSPSWAPAPPAWSGSSDCNTAPLYLPPPTFPNLPTIHARKPLTIPLQVPSVIPVGKVCVCKAIQIQPCVVPAPKPVYTCGCGKDVVITRPENPCAPQGHTSHCPC